MSTAYDQTGRTRQKARTREALIAATRELLAEGHDPRVEQAADRAGVSRSTAYRYFPNQELLLAATYPEIDAVSLLGDDPPDDALRRLDIVVENLTGQVLRYELELRMQLRLSLAVRDGTPLPLRQGRAIGWIEEALAPAAGRLGRARLRRLVLAIRATIGIEAFAWLVDVGGASREQAVAIMRESARTLARASLDA